MTSLDPSARPIGLEVGLCPLSPRELDVLRGVAEGMTTDQLAAKIRNSPQTIKNQLAQVMEKLGAPNRTAAVVIALQQGWIGLAGVQVQRRAGLAAVLGEGYVSGGAPHAMA